MHKRSLLSEHLRITKLIKFAFLYEIFFSTFIEWTTTQGILLSGTDSVSVHLCRPMKQINIKVKRYAKYQRLHLRRLSTFNRGSFKCSRNHFISDKCKQYNHLSYISFQIITLCRYTLLPTTVKVMEILLEAILWNLFQLFRHILNDVSSVTKAPSLQCWSQSINRVKTSWSQVGCSSVVTLFFVKKSLTKSERCAGALPSRRNQLFVLPFSGRFLLTASLTWLRMSMYRNFPHVTIPVNFTSDFRELLEATTYIPAC